jgi:uncharacterized protein with GYD domain
MEKSPQKYFVLVKVGPTEAGGIYDAIMKWSQQPIQGVKLEEAYQVFGKWDFAFLFSADTNENALHFVGDRIRQVDGVVATTTMPLAPMKDYR